MLAVFSQPTRTSVLALRRERYALSRLIRRTARQRLMVELQGWFRWIPPSSGRFLAGSGAVVRLGRGTRAVRDK